MFYKLCILLYLKLSFLSQVSCDDVTPKSPKIAAKIQYGKHYVTRTFSTLPTVEISTASSPAKRRVRVRRTRTTNVLLTTSTVSSEGNLSINTEANKTSSRSPKYTTNWWRYTTNYRGASPPYPLMYFPEVLEVRHNISKWWDPRYTEWFNLFTGRTAFSRWRVFTVRMYPWKELSTVFKPALPGIENKMIRNYARQVATTKPSNVMKRKYWEILMPLSQGPFRAYRPVYWYEQRNLSCPHPVVTNTLTPYTGPPLIEFFDCDNFQHNYHYGYDDSDLYSEEAHLVDKFGSREDSDSFQSESVEDRHKGKVYDPEAQEQDSLTVEHIENLKNLSARMLEESRNRSRTITDGFLLPVTKATKKPRRKPSSRPNTTLEHDYDEGGADVRDTSEFEYMMQEYMNLDERTDLHARKLRRRKIRTMCGQIISTLKKKLNTIWWKTFWKQTMTTPSRKKQHRTTPWFRYLNQMQESSYPLDSLSL